MGDLRQCTTKGCDSFGVRNFGGAWKCAKHHRFGAMRTEAKRRGKLTPTFDELESLLAKNLSLICPGCNKAMTLSWSDGAADLLTLQHYRDGSIGLCCFSCNSRHGAMPGDSFFSVPVGMKFCPACKTNKAHSEFGKDKRSFLRLTSYCKACISVRQAGRVRRTAMSSQISN